MDILKYAPVLIFVVIVIAIIAVIVRGRKNRSTDADVSVRTEYQSPNRETDALCKTLSPEELYEKACGLVDENGLKSDYYRWEKFISTAAGKGYIPAVREWGIYNANTNNALALDLLIKAADAGDGKAVEELFGLYYYGSHRGVPRIEKDRDKAARYIEPYAGKGNAVAQRLLGNYYNYEKRDSDKALEWYLKAADGGDAKAMVEASEIYSFEEDHEAEKRLLLKAAEQNYGEAEVSLGIFFHNPVDDDVTPDYEQAMYWYKRAFEHGRDTAACYLGEMYLNGEGVPKDEYQAFEWFKKAYDNGSVYGMYLYGKCYMEGIGVAPDKRKGIELYTKAAKYDGDAQCALGLCYLEGNGVKKDLKTAVSYLKKAVDNPIENEEAQNKLEELYNSGVINKDDL